MISLREHCLRYRKEGQEVYFISLLGNIFKGKITTVRHDALAITWYHYNDPTYYFYHELEHWKELVFTC